MIVVDTNVISELFKPSPDPKVMAWMGRLPGDRLFTTAITYGELLFGLYRMPAGRRSENLREGLTRLFGQQLEGRILAYDGAAADAHAAIAAARSARGRPVGQSDAMIAGIARSRGAAIATRDQRGFEGCDIELINPWH